MKLRLALVACSVVFLGAGVASAATLSYTCDPSVAAATCTYLNTTVAGLYNSTFTNAGADIYIQYGTTGLASTLQFINETAYSTYVADLNANPHKDALQTSALAALGTYDATPYGAGKVGISVALGTAVGITGLTGINTSDGTCAFPSAGCYDAIVTVTNAPSTWYYDNLGGPEPSSEYDFYAAVEHETDEVLGTSSCIDTQTNPLSNGCNVFGAGTPSANDLFRYSSAGNLVLNSSLSTTPGAYFSYNGGVSNGANGFVYNTLDNGDDYADFVANCPAGPLSVQDAEGCPGVDAGLSITNDGGAEINMLNAVGYDLQQPAAPEPGTIVLLGSSLAILLGYRRRRRS